MKFTPKEKQLIEAYTKKLIENRSLNELSDEEFDSIQFGKEIPALGKEMFLSIKKILQHPKWEKEITRMIIEKNSQERVKTKDIRELYGELLIDVTNRMNEFIGKYGVQI